MEIKSLRNSVRYPLARWVCSSKREMASAARIFTLTVDLLAAFLFLLTSLFCAYRLFLKFVDRFNGRADGQRSYVALSSHLDRSHKRPDNQRSALRWFTSAAVYFVLCLYGISRTVTLCIFAFDESLNSGDMTTHLITTIPASMFLALQTVFIVKWELQARDLTQILRNHRFHLGRIAIGVSAFLAIFAMIVVICAMIDSGAHFAKWDDETWNHLMVSTVGLAYAFNGVALLLLGILLRHLWKPQADHARTSSNRALAIAIVFGCICILRGIILILFLFDDEHRKKLHDVMHSNAGPAGVLLGEWLGITFSLYHFLAASRDRREQERRSNNDEPDGKASLSQRFVDNDITSPTFSAAGTPTPSGPLIQEEVVAPAEYGSVYDRTSDWGYPPDSSATYPSAPASSFPQQQPVKPFLDVMHPGSFATSPVMKATNPASPDALIEEVEPLPPLRPPRPRHVSAPSSAAPRGYGSYSTSPYFAHRIPQAREWAEDEEQ